MNEYYIIEDRIARTSGIFEKGDIEDALYRMFDINYDSIEDSEAEMDAIANIVDCIYGRTTDNGNMWGCDYLNVTVERYYPYEDMPRGCIAYKARIGGLMQQWECGAVPTVWVADVVDCFNANARIRHEFASEKSRDEYIKTYGYEVVDYHEHDSKIWATVVGTDIVVPVQAHYDVAYGV